MDEAGEQNRISEKKYWSIVSYEVPVSLVSVELDGEPSWIPKVQI